MAGRHLTNIDNTVASFTVDVTITATGANWDDVVSINTGDLSEGYASIDFNGTYDINFTSNVTQSTNNSSVYVRILINGVAYSASFVEEKFKAGDLVAPIATSAHGTNIAKNTVIKVQAQVSSGTGTFDNGVLKISGQPDVNTI